MHRHWISKREEIRLQTTTKLARNLTKGARDKRNRTSHKQFEAWESGALIQELPDWNRTMDRHFLSLKDTFSQHGDVVEGTDQSVLLLVVDLWFRLIRDWPVKLMDVCDSGSDMPHGEREIVRIWVRQVLFGKWSSHCVGEDEQWGELYICCQVPAG
jgi:hypothetical protein